MCAYLDYYFTSVTRSSQVCDHGSHTYTHTHTPDTRAHNQTHTNTHTHTHEELQTPAVLRPVMLCMEG